MFAEHSVIVWVLLIYIVGVASILSINRGFPNIFRIKDLSDHHGCLGTGFASCFNASLDLTDFSLD